jgi:hypothetical protein
MLAACQVRRKAAARLCSSRTHPLSLLLLIKTFAPASRSTENAASRGRREIRGRGQPVLTRVPTATASKLAEPPGEVAEWLKALAC